jgi:phage tail-like protein
MTSLNGRSYTAGKFLFELDGHRCGYLQSFDGGDLQGEIAEHRSGTSNSNKKHMTTFKYTPIKMRTGIGMSKGMYLWIQAAFDLGVLYKNGAVTVANFDYKSQRRMDIINMLMTKVTLPTLDGSSKESGYFDLEFVPESCRWLKESGADVRGEIGAKQKGWHCANWRLELSGLETACKRVAKIEGISWECKTTRDDIGDSREQTIHPVATTVSDWTIHMSMADIEPFAQKAKQWFIDGKCLEGDEMTASITLLGPDMSTEFGRIEFLNVGIKEFKANPKMEGQNEAVARGSMKLYAEQVRFHLLQTDA